MSTAAAASPPVQRKSKRRQSVGKWLLLPLVIGLAIGGYFVWKYFQPAKLPDGFAVSNGRLEATEIDVAAKIAGRVLDEQVDEGDYVTAGQIVAHMDIEVLLAQRARGCCQTCHGTKCRRHGAEHAGPARKRESGGPVGRGAARSRTWILPSRTWIASWKLTKRQERSASKTSILTVLQCTALKRLGAAQIANVAAADATISTAKALVIAAESNVASAQATIERIQADIDDSTLKAPRDGRVQYRIAQAGEVLNGGGKVLNMVDLNDVYMTFFLPTDWAGRVKMGAEVRLVLDAAPQFVIPAKVTFVTDVAQFTPKTVETAEERQKLTFRIKAHIDKGILKNYVRDVKTGLPGMAFVQLDPQAAWPTNLQVKLPE